MSEFLKLTPKQILNNLYTEYGLVPEDVYVDSKYKIINRQGIDKIQARAGITLTNHIEYISPDAKTVVVKAIGTKGDQIIDSFGESAPHNYEQKQIRKGPNAGKELPYYPVAMAEKRARARVVLRLAGLYEVGFFSEDESDEFKEKENTAKAQNKDAADKALGQITNKK